jgi:hypothetical protein
MTVGRNEPCPCDVQAQERVFTWELEKCIFRNFPNLIEGDKRGDREAREKINALIGAARAGAGLYTAAELQNEEDLLDRIPNRRAQIPVLTLRC